MPNILYIDDVHRDTLVLHALNLQDSALDDILSQNACIPVTPNGKCLISIYYQATRGNDGSQDVHKTHYYENGPLFLV